MPRVLRLLDRPNWETLRKSGPALFQAIKHFERRDYAPALCSFETMIKRIPEPRPTYLAFYAYLLLLNASVETVDAWENVVLAADGDESRASRYAKAVARYYLATFGGSPDASRHWHEANRLQPTRGVAAYIRLPELAQVP